MTEAARSQRERARRIEALRVRGVGGGVIAPHRAMVGLPWTMWRFVVNLLLSLGGFALVVGSLPRLARFWEIVFERARAFTGINAALDFQQVSLPGKLGFGLPFLAAVTPQPGPAALWIGGVGAGLVVVLSFLLPQCLLPWRYFLRLIAALQVSSLAFFAVSADPFPYRLVDHVVALETGGLVVMGLVPLVLGLTLHVFDLALWKKILLTLAILTHLAIFIPLQAMVHIWLVLHATALVMPVLFFGFGLVLDVLIFVAFYGWALSWRGELEGHKVRPPAHLSPKGSRA